MIAVMRGLMNDGSSLRGLTGQGEPGLATLLGGTSPELSADNLRLSGGPGQVGATGRIARARNEQRVAAAAAGGDYITPDARLPGGGGRVRPPILP